MISSRHIIALATLMVCFGCSSGGDTAHADASFPAPKVGVYEARRHAWVVVPADMEHFDQEVSDPVSGGPGAR